MVVVKCKVGCDHNFAGECDLEVITINGMYWPICETFSKLKEVATLEEGSSCKHDLRREYGEGEERGVPTLSFKDKVRRRIHWFR